MADGELTHPFGRGINLQIEVSAIDALQDKCRTEQVPIFLAPEKKEYRRGDVSFAAVSSSCRILTAIFCASSRGWEPCRRRIDRRRRPHGRDAGGKAVGDLPGRGAMRGSARYIRRSRNVHGRATLHASPKVTLQVPLQASPEGGVPRLVRIARKALRRAATRDLDPRRARAQSEGHRPHHSARQARGVHGAFRLGQIVARLRHHLCGRPAPLCREPLGLCPPVPRDDAKARCRSHRGALAGDLHRAKDDIEESALDRRHRHRDL